MKMYCNKPIERLQISMTFVYTALEMFHLGQFYPQCDDCADKPCIVNVSVNAMSVAIILSTCIILCTSRIFCVHFVYSTHFFCMYILHVLCCVLCVVWLCMCSCFLHMKVCSQVKCGFLYTWLICNIGISLPPACLCNELEDEKQEINLEWP